MGSRRPPPRRRGGNSRSGSGREPDPPDHYRRGGTAGRSRGQSTTLDYTLTLAVATLVVTGLLVVAGDFVTDRREQVIRTELGVVGQQLAGELTAADRLVQSGDATSEVVVNKSLPGQVTGTGYTIETGGTDSKQWVELSTNQPAVTVEIRVQTKTKLKETAVPGGEVAIVYNSDRLEVRS